jgi:signal transduction histidine kinase
LLATLTPSPLLNEAVGLIDKTDDCLDQILSDGLPPDLAQKGLPVALADLVRQRSQAGSVQLTFTHKNVDIDKAASLSIMQVRQLYRIANELINNAMKHANAKKCEIVFKQGSNGWQLSVADDGQGFDTTLTQKQAGIGLKNLSARAQTLGAIVTLKSDESGTVISVEG